MNINHKRKIFDCTFFNDEIHLILFRLEEYYDFVDYFVIVEINKTHTGYLKSFSNFLKNEHLFAKYKDKIIFKYFDNAPNFVDNHISAIERYHRKCINNILYSKANINDIIFISDSDEFWDTKTLKHILDNPPNVYVYHQNLYYYYVNYLQNQIWVGSISFPYGIISVIESRRIIDKFNSLIFNYDKNDLIKLKDALEYTNINLFVDGGNHYSWLNHNNSIVEKSLSIYESNIIKSNFKIENDIVKKINLGEDILNRKGWQFKKIFINKNSLPNPPIKLEWFLNNYPQLYKNLPEIKIKKNVEIICPIFNNINFLDMVYSELKKAKINSKIGWDISIKILALDANKKVLNYLKEKQIPHLIYKSFNPKEYYIKRVYKGYNYAGFNSKFDNIIFVNSDMVFSKNWLDNLLIYHDGINIPTSLLIESGNLQTRNYNYLKKLHIDVNNINFKEFEYISSLISKDKIQTSGTYMPVIFEKKRFIESGGYPKGHVKNERGKISLGKKIYKSGDQFYFEIYWGINIKWITLLFLILFLTISKKEKKWVKKINNLLICIFDVKISSWITLKLSAKCVNKCICYSNFY
ncbi:MAG: hypothetical protein ACRCW6_01925 [Mycoplasmoidaceae bacterium]